MMQGNKSVAGVVRFCVVLSVMGAAGCFNSTREKDAGEFRDPILRRAQARLKEGDKDGALICLNQSMDRKPGMAQPHLEAAQLYDEYKKDYVRAIYHYSRYLELRPSTEKRNMIEELIRKSKMSYAASISEQLPAAVEVRMRTLQEENLHLKNDLREVKESLARLNAENASLSNALTTAKTAASARAVATASAAATSNAISRISSPIVAAPGGLASASTSSAETYRVQPGDTLSVVATRVYHDSKKWKLIYEANKDALHGSERLKQGQTLIIPRQNVKR